MEIPGASIPVVYRHPDIFSPGSVWVAVCPFLFQSTHTHTPTPPWKPSERPPCSLDPRGWHPPVIQSKIHSASGTPPPPNAWRTNGGPLGFGGSRRTGPRPPLRAQRARHQCRALASGLRMPRLRLPISSSRIPFALREGGWSAATTGDLHAAIPLIRRA